MSGHSERGKMTQNGCCYLDEAHCMDTWSKDFRPSYQQLDILRKYGLPIVSLIGTATKQTLQTISTALQMKTAK